MVLASTRIVPSSSSCGPRVHPRMWFSRPPAYVVLASTRVCGSRVHPRISRPPAYVVLASTHICGSRVHPCMWFSRPPACVVLASTRFAFCSPMLCCANASSAGYCAARRNPCAVASAARQQSRTKGGCPSIPRPIGCRPAGAVASGQSREKRGGAQSSPNSKGRRALILFFRHVRSAGLPERSDRQ